MRKISPYILFAFIALCCKTESDVKPASGSFIRYFGSENNQDAVLALEAGDGYSLLSNVEIQESATQVNYKAQLTHTDLNGNLLWHVNYPAFGPSGTTGSMKGASFIPLANSGYLIVGDSINADGSSELFLLRTDLNGNMQDIVTISGEDIGAPGASLQGNAVMQLEDNNGPYFIALGSIKNAATGIGDMFVGRFRIDDLFLEWKRTYGAGTASVTNRISVNSTQNIFWAGSVGSEGQQDIRLVEAPEDSQGTITGDPIVSPNINEVANDFCKTVEGWAITGSSNKDGDADIYLLRVDNAAKFRSERTIRVPGTNGNDAGNSICAGVDGGLVILGTVEYEATQQDLFLTKRDFFSGEEVWQARYGGIDREEGASIRTTSDESYLVFGTTYFGPRVKKLILMKVNRNGQL